MTVESASISRQSSRVETTAALAAHITWTASKQSFLTLRLLADGGKKADALRAYAYFRWVDDTLDAGALNKKEARAFLKRQKQLLAALKRGRMVRGLAPEEQILADLLREAPAVPQGLQSYLDHLLAVMAFDTERRGRYVSQNELDAYSYHLAAGVTEMLHHFVGCTRAAPAADPRRYLAATGAHIAHMLRDTHDDLAAGYFNIPSEVLDEHLLEPHDFGSPAYRHWVRDRVEQARADFQGGRAYLARVPSFRCRLAGYSYIARFEGVLDLIERDDFVLRDAYPETKTPTATLAMIGSALTSAAMRKANSANPHPVVGKELQ